MKYNYCGNSGLLLPQISLGMWQNFGDADNIQVAREMILHAFENGVTHFDLANNYGMPRGSAESNFGKILNKDLKDHRDEMIITSKAGHLMWDGPYGDGSSRKYIMASINQSLKRTGLEYFDVFYSHRYNPETPLEETAQALIDIVKQGKALYIGLSKYPADKAEQMYRMMAEQHVKCVVYQDRYNMINRKVENAHVALNQKSGVGFVSFSPLAQGVLTDRYLHGIPKDSRVGRASNFLTKEDITPSLMASIEELNVIAVQRGQSLAQMALAWQLSKDYVTSVIIGASSVRQLQDNLDSIHNTSFAEEEALQIDQILDKHLIRE